MIAVSETWLDNDKVAEVRLEGYELYTTNRNYKKGGGVGLYIDKTLRRTIVKKASYIIENVLECITVETEVEKNKNIMLSCVYRPPGTNVI